jgi:hypothetical protein
MDPAFFDLDRCVFRRAGRRRSGIILALVGPHPLRWAQAANRESGSGFGGSDYLSQSSRIESAVASENTPCVITAYVIYEHYISRERGPECHDLAKLYSSCKVMCSTQG